MIFQQAMFDYWMLIQMLVNNGKHMNAYHTWSIMEPIRAIYFIVHIFGQCSKPMVDDDRELYQPFFGGIIRQHYIEEIR